MTTYCNITVQKKGDRGLQCAITFNENDLKKVRDLGKLRLSYKRGRGKFFLKQDYVGGVLPAVYGRGNGGFVTWRFPYGDGKTIPAGVMPGRHEFRINIDGNIEIKREPETETSEEEKKEPVEVVEKISTKQKQTPAYILVRSKTLVPLHTVVRITQSERHATIVTNEPRKSNDDGLAQFIADLPLTFFDEYMEAIER